jgi:hypothetical protein
MESVRDGTGFHPLELSFEFNLALRHRGATNCAMRADASPTPNSFGAVSGELPDADCPLGFRTQSAFFVHFAARY